MSNFSTVDMLCFTGIKFFFRDVDRNELATYFGNTLTEWYVWGSDMVGKIKGSAKYYFFKDHLGSVRAVVDNNFNLVSAVDGACPRVLLAGDMWGDKMQGRIYNGDSTKFGFTGKEQDDENLYDYFGARYYDSRIGRWVGVEPKHDKFVSYTPYQYAILNPLKFLDNNGLDVFVALSGNAFSSTGEINENTTGTGKTIEAVRNLVSEYQVEDFDVKGFYTPIFGNSVVEEAVNYIIQNLQRENEKVFLYGYSLGGVKILDVASELNRRGISVEVLFDVDPTNYTLEPEKEVSPNVKTAHYWYTKEIEDRIKLTSKSGMTEIISHKETGTAHSEVDEKAVDFIREEIRKEIEGK